MINRKKRTPGLLGVSLNDKELALAHVVGQPGDFSLSFCECRTVANLQDAGKQLAECVRSQGFEQLRCNFVLAPEDYSLLLVEAPHVEPAEMAAAAKWKIKDMVDRPIEQLAISVFPVPGDAYRGQREMLYVVAAERKRIQQVVDMVERAGLTLESIDIPELAMRNLMTGYEDDSEGIAVMDLRASGSLLNLSRGGAIYLTRHLSTQMGDDVVDSPEWDEIRDRLVLEIQRSLDYYESQMGQGHIGRVLVSPRKHDAPALENQLNEAMGVRVEVMDLRKNLGTAVELSTALQHSALMAIGGALRAGRTA